MTDNTITDNIINELATTIHREMTIKDNEIILLEDKCFKYGGRLNFAHKKIRDMRKVIDIPQHVADVYLNSIDYTTTSCPICLDKLQSKNNVKLTNCGHIYCKNCYIKLESRVMKCPICKNSVVFFNKKQWYEDRKKYENREKIDSDEEECDLDNFGFTLSDEEI